jgi:8-amino-7-oxononanoate synthase
VAGDARPLAYLDDALAALDRASSRRVRRSRVAPGLVDLSSNDYLGLARAPEARAGAFGAGASRLVTGDDPAHERLERALAAWLGAEDALVFSSGYAANVGTVGALVGEGDLVVSDALNHASIIDGCRLSRARVAVVPHLDVGAVDAALRAHPRRRALVVTESWFSMDGDSPDLAALRAVCEAHGAALMVDEAHALGVFGPEGRGLAAAAGVTPDVFVGTFGKAFGGAGAFVAGSAALLDWLWNRARAFVFSTGMPPVLAEVLADRLPRIRAAEAERAWLAALAVRVRRAVPGRLPTVGHGPIVPIVMGTNDAALAASAHLRAHGFHVGAIRPPTVPEGTARLRLTLRADCTEEVIVRLESALRSLP